MRDDDRARLYAGYSEWKSWDLARNGNRDRDRAREAFAIEFANAKVPRGAKVLELGFGRGELLDWCRDMGYQACGIELIPELVDHARSVGHEVFLCGGPPPRLDGAMNFDLIVAFDVFEHLSVSELNVWLKWMAEHLRLSGKILARFPNGGSPFGRLYQGEDLTHQLILTGASIDQIARLSGLRLIAVNNSARALGGGHRSALWKRLAYIIRDFLEFLISHVYYGRRIPLDPNLTVLLGCATNQHAERSPELD